MRACILCFILLFAHGAYSQAPSFRKLSCPEKRWVMLHPFIAKKAFRITVEARVASKEMETDTLLDQDVDGGQVDAFRHAFWMARLSQEICWRKAKRLGKAHERGNYIDFKKHRSGEETFSDSIAGAMDSFNNGVGINFGRANKKLTADETRKAIVQKILQGEMKIVLKDGKGNFLDCDHHPIDMKKYLRTWNIPRCLVNSNVIN
jgi:hypothetical protein